MTYLTAPACQPAGHHAACCGCACKACSLPYWSFNAVLAGIVPDTPSRQVVCAQVHFINHFSGCQMCTAQNKNEDYEQCERESVKSHECAPCLTPAAPAPSLAAALGLCCVLRYLPHKCSTSAVPLLLPGLLLALLHAVLSWWQSSVLLARACTSALSQTRHSRAEGCSAARETRADMSFCRYANSVMMKMLARRAPRNVTQHAQIAALPFCRVSQLCHTAAAVVVLTARSQRSSALSAGYQTPAVQLCSSVLCEWQQP